MAALLALLTSRSGSIIICFFAQRQSVPVGEASPRSLNGPLANKTVAVPCLTAFVPD
jgi:hypothetical protein